MIQELNPDHPNINEKLFKNLNNILSNNLYVNFIQIQIQVVNDQAGFAEFCYDMVSCKEGNLFACAKIKQIIIYINLYNKYTILYKRNDKY